jgi:hypothetical protein
LQLERDLIISILKLTRNGPVKQESLKTDAKIPSSACSTLLRKLQSANLVYFEGEAINVDSACRLQLAVRAAELGSDVERLSQVLSWQEFEGIAGVAMERNGYVVKKNVRFKREGRRWEIDVVGCRNPFVLCVDCKHWHQGLPPSALSRMVESQVKRAEAFAHTLQNTSLPVECTRWEKAKVVPIILSLLPAACKFLNDVPIVPVLQMQDFINQLPAYMESLKYFSVRFSHL